MIEQITALEKAHHYALTRHSCGKIGDMTVYPGDGMYEVRLVELPDANEGQTYELSVDAVSGDVTSSSKADTAAGYHDDSIASKASSFIDGAQAYKAALKAIAGYEHYNKHGRFTVRLTKDGYVVTFPLTDDGGRDADYAYEITVDARTANIDQMLVAS